MNDDDKTFLFAAVVGSGLTAKMADSAGAQYLLALNAGRFRVQGASSLACFLPVRPANDWVMEFAEREMLGRCSAAIHAGFSVSDPMLDMDALIDRAQALGFKGICNFPSATSIDGRLGTLMDREGLGFSREVELVEKSTRAGMDTFVYVQTNVQARRMVDAGATAICVNIGFTGGATGVSTHLTLETAAVRIDRVLEGVPAGVDKLCHGGPITSPEQALAVTRMCGVQGFVAGSTLDRIPLEQTLTEVTKGFTAIPSLARLTQPTKNTGHVLVGGSPAMQHIREDIDELTHDDIPVLITGETGTGKSFSARLLHDAGPASGRQPVVIDCPALTAEDGGTHLLGYAAGGRGGSASHRGALEQASGSTVIFEDIAALVPEHQGKLLKFVDEGVVQRIGDHTLRKVAARVVSTASSEQELISDQLGIRKDLFYRISGHVIALPPLRERAGDIPELVLHLGSPLTGGDDPSFTNAAMRVFLEHDWPGNMRELKHAVVRAIRNARGASVDLKAVEFLRNAPRVNPPSQDAETTRNQIQSEQDWIAEALSRNGFRRAKTAEDLGMTTRTLYNKIRKYGLQT